MQTFALSNLKAWATYSHRLPGQVTHRLICIRLVVTERLVNATALDETLEDGLMWALKNQLSQVTLSLCFVKA